MDRFCEGRFKNQRNWTLFWGRGFREAQSPHAAGGQRKGTRTQIIAETILTTEKNEQQRWLGGQVLPQRKWTRV